MYFTLFTLYSLIYRFVCFFLFQVDLLALSESRGDVRTRFIRVGETAAVWMDLRKDTRGHLFTTQLTEISRDCGVRVCAYLPGSFWRAGCVTRVVFFGERLLGIVLPHTRLKWVWLALRGSVFVAPVARLWLSGHSGGRGYAETGVVSERVKRCSRTPRPSRCWWAVNGCPAAWAAPDCLHVTRTTSRFIVQTSNKKKQQLTGYFFLSYRHHKQTQILKQLIIKKKKCTNDVSTLQTHYFELHSGLNYKLFREWLPLFLFTE